MLRLMLLRHAKSDWSVAGASDHERPLNERGRTAAVKMGAYMAAEKLIPALILCSTATRTRETCKRVVAAFPRQPSIHYERRLYEAGPETIVDLIAAMPDDAQTILVIGHNPGLQLAALSLIAPASTKPHANLREKFPTAALAVIEFEFGAWSGLKSREGRLERFVTPRDIGRTD
jgi:phosphohistidine phosphatase